MGLVEVAKRMGSRNREVGKTPNGAVVPQGEGVQDKEEGYLWLAIMDGSGHLTHTLLECTLLGTDTVGGRVGNRNHCSFVSGC